MTSKDQKVHTAKLPDGKNLRPGFFVLFTLFTREQVCKDTDLRLISRPISQCGLHRWFSENF